jgi:hypothetical protein
MPITREEVLQAPVNPNFNGIKITAEGGTLVGFSVNELDDVYYKLSSGRYEDACLLESVSFDAIDEFWNPASVVFGEDMLLEAVTIPSYARTGQRMKAVVRVMNKALSSNESGITAEAPIVGKPKKQGNFAYVTVQLPFSDGQSVSIIFHSPEGDKKKIEATDPLIAFRWLLNKRDITHVVAPESGREISLEEISKRVSQLVEKNHVRFMKTQKAAMEEQKELEATENSIAEIKEQITTTTEKVEQAVKQKETVESKIEARDVRISKLADENAKLEAEIVELKAKKAATAPQEGGSDGEGANPEVTDEVVPDEEVSRIDPFWKPEKLPSDVRTALKKVPVRVTVGELPSTFPKEVRRGGHLIMKASRPITSGNDIIWGKHFAGINPEGQYAAQSIEHNRKLDASVIAVVSKEQAYEYLTHKFGDEFTNSDADDEARMELAETQLSNLEGLAYPEFLKAFKNPTDESEAGEGEGEEGLNNDTFPEESVIRALNGVVLGKDTAADMAADGGYAGILKDKLLQEKYQDALDHILGIRIVEVRNALRDLGWSGEQNGTLSKNGVTAKFEYEHVGAGKNVVGYSINGIRDDLTALSEELARQIDTTAPTSANEPEVEEGADVNEPYPVGFTWAEGMKNFKVVDREGEKYIIEDTAMAGMFPEVVTYEELHNRVTNPPRPERGSGEFNPAVESLKSIVAGAYDHDPEGLEAALDEAAEYLEERDLLKRYDELLNEAADKAAQVAIDGAKGVA